MAWKAFSEDEIYSCKGWFLTSIESFLFERRLRVVLNGQESEWLTVKAGVPQGSIPGPLFFLYILTIYQIVSLWANKSKMSFKPNRSKQVQEVIFSWTINKVYHPPLLFNSKNYNQKSFRDTSWWITYMQTSY